MDTRKAGENRATAVETLEVPTPHPHDGKVRKVLSNAAEHVFRCLHRYTTK